MPASNSPTLSKGVQALFPATHQSKAYTGTAGTIDNVVTGSVIRVVVTTNAYIKIGASPTATTSDVFMAANIPEYFRCNPGVDKVSAIQAAAGGTLHVTEMD
jgi:hypothetical protein